MGQLHNLLQSLDLVSDYHLVSDRYFTKVHDGKLIELDLSDLQITHLDPDIFSNHNHLRRLDLSYNNLSQLNGETFGDLPNLKELSLRGNKLISLPPNLFRANSNIVYLDISHNYLQELNQYIFSSLGQLRDLNLSHNLLPTIPPALFSFLSSLSILSMNHNTLKSLPKELFTSNSKLWELFLHQNRILSFQANVFSPLINLHRLWLGNNQLEVIDSIPCLRNLVVLDLSLNFLKMIPLNFIGHLQKLRRLDLRLNKFTALQKAKILAFYRINNINKTQVILE